MSHHPALTINRRDTGAGHMTPWYTPTIRDAAVVVAALIAVPFMILGVFKVAEIIAIALGLS